MRKNAEPAKAAVHVGVPRKHEVGDLAAERVAPAERPGVVVSARLWFVLKYSKVDVRR